MSHPILLTGLVFALLGCASFVRAFVAGTAVSWDEDGWMASVGVLMLGIFTMVATNHSALRDRREHTVEQHAMLPVLPPARTSGLLAATLWPAGIAAVLVVALAALGAAKGLAPDSVELIHLAERVVSILLLGAIGIALAAWAPSPFVAPVVAWFIFFMTPGEAPAAWHSLVPWETMNSTGLATWHLMYLAGLTAAFAVLALARTSRPRALIVPAIASMTLIAVSGVALFDGACPSVGRCLF
ncbi:MAG: hypothetical protein ABI572_11900 [Actinomycetota bacterium]